MRPRVAARTVVVPFESRAQIICDPDVVARWINVAADDVDDALLDAMHVMDDAWVGPTGISQEIANSLGRCTQIFRWRKLKLSAESADVVRLRGYAASARQHPPVVRSHEWQAR